MRNRFLTLITLLCLMSTGALAQSDYYDVVVDGVETGNMYLDWYGAPAQSQCGGMDFESTINGQTRSGSAFYPNNIHISQQDPAGPPISYTWERDVTHYGIQRGGNCGPYATGRVFWPIYFAITFTEATQGISDPSGYCAQQNACTNTSTPQCPIGKILQAVGQFVACDEWHESLVPVVNSICLPGIAFQSVTGGGYCTVKTS